MVDKINVPKVATAQQTKEFNNQSSSKSNVSLREGFKSLSSTLTVAGSARELGVQGPNKGNPPGSSKPSLVTGKLDDAVKYSKDAISALEDITAGSLKPDTVNELLSEEDEDDSSGVKLFTYNREEAPVRQLADDLKTLKKDLKNLFEALKEKASQSAVTSENREASSARIEDLDQAKAQADLTSSEIQFNVKDALQAHSRLSINSVVRLLDDNDARLL